MTPAISWELVLVDTSVWIHHFKRPNRTLIDLVEAEQAALHEMVFGELLLGAIPQGDRAIEDLGKLPFVLIAAYSEVVDFVQNNRLEGSGIGWVDTHLLVAAKAIACQFWTMDIKLKRVARRLGIDFADE